MDENALRLVSRLEHSVSSPNPGWHAARIVLITPVHNEEGYITAMMESIAAQTVKPLRWVIVDDGSCDRTPSMIAEFAQKHDFIELVALQKRAERHAGGEGAIPSALRLINVESIDFLARFDADLVFPANYFELILREFERDAKLGIAGGRLYIDRGSGKEYENSPEFHVRGALKMYRRQCFLDIGGLTSQFGWDTIDEVMAWSKGWTTKSFASPEVLHRRPTGQGTQARRLFRLRGQGEYRTWSHPIHVAVKSLYIAAHERSLILAFCYLWGYSESVIRRPERIQDPAFTQARRKQQLDRITGMIPFFTSYSRHQAR